jgi:hypothetical protein
MDRHAAYQAKYKKHYLALLPALRDVSHAFAPNAEDDKE